MKEFGNKDKEKRGYDTRKKFDGISSMTVGGIKDTESDSTTG